MSGAFGVTRMTEKELPESWKESVKSFGAAGSETRLSNDVFDILGKLSANRIASLPYFYFDCGTEDASYIFSPNRELSALMFEKKIPHEFRELPGDHSWTYWDRQVQEILKIAAEKMRMPKRISRA
jgi:S-formylglutathione hydrolase FrmB